MLNLSLSERSGGRGLSIRQFLATPKHLRAYARHAIAQAVSEYARGILRPANILDRFGADGLVRYGLRTRSYGYRRRQERDPTLMRAQAFISPRSVNIGSLVNRLRSLAQAKDGSQALTRIAESLNAQNAGRPHMRDLVTKPGIGHTIAVSGVSKLRIMMTWPAARPLNANPQYGEEFRDLTLAGGRDWWAIKARASAIFAALIRERPHAVAA